MLPTYNSVESNSLWVERRDASDFNFETNFNTYKTEIRIQAARRVWEWIEHKRNYAEVYTGQGEILAGLGKSVILQKDAKENLAMPASPMPSAKEKMKERCKDGPKASPQRVASPVLSKEREKNKEKQKNKEKLKDVNKEKKNEEEGRSRSEKEKAQQEKEKERTREVVRNKVKETKERPSSVFKNENRGSAKETTCKEEEEPRLKKERREENVAKRERNDQYNKKEKKEEMAEVFEASKKVRHFIRLDYRREILRDIPQWTCWKSSWSVHYRT